MKKILFLIVFTPALINAQSVNQEGINFEEGLSWKQVVAKAKSENKYIFVDCYTTWCGPCKKMEKEVYPVTEVGAVYNDKFISIKMQMDTGVNDNEIVKASYADARYIQNQYNINAYPSFLFFTPDGKILNRSEGVKDPEEFNQLANTTTDPAKNFYTVLEKFNHGHASASEASWLATQALLLGDTAISNRVAKEYVSRLSKDSLFTEWNISFMNEFTKTSGDKGFTFFYKNADSINRIMQSDNFAQTFIQSIIYKEIVLPQVTNADKRGVKPDWMNIHATIEDNYTQYYADRVVTAARSSYGLSHNDNKEYTKYLVEFQEKFGSKKDTGFWASFTLNNYAYAVFESSNNKQELEAALGWSTRAILMAPGANWFDTYASILYKLNRKQEALAWERIAVELAPTNNGFQKTLEKMENNEPIWPLDDKAPSN